MNTSYKNLDEAFVPLYEQLVAHADVVSDIEDVELGIKQSITGIGIETPVEIQVYNDEYGNLAIGSTPPVYHMATTIMPVFHKIRFNITKTEKVNIDKYLQNNP
jgi:hypothetical protein